MAVFFHHVGEVGATRDFPRTVFDGDDLSRLRAFRAGDILPELEDLPEPEIARIAAATRGTAGFQIWGIPSGGSRLFQRTNEGDYWLLLDTDRPGGSISYAGRIICKLESPSFRLSNYLWGEAKFPLILLLDGFRTNFEITEFKEAFGYSPNWYMRGWAYRLTDQRIAASTFQTEQAFLQYLRSLVTGVDSVFSTGFEEPPVDEFVTEGGLALVAHLARERDRSLILKFKTSLKSFECCVCRFDFEKTYGALGREFIEAHHVKPLGKGGKRETRIGDLRPVCSNCHRMLHKGLGMSVDDLRKLLKFTQK